MERQLEEGMALAAASDLLELEAYPVGSPSFLATFRRPRHGATGGWVDRGGELFPGRYLVPTRLLAACRSVRDASMVWAAEHLAPEHLGHDAADLRGRLTPGMSLVDILYQIFELITFNKFTSLENDCLNKACCSSARQHQHRFPVDRRPLKRRPLNLEVSPQ